MQREYEPNSEIYIVHLFQGLNPHFNEQETRQETNCESTNENKRFFGLKNLS